jgi:hypothetical protein
MIAMLAAAALICGLLLGLHGLGAALRDTRR